MGDVRPTPVSKRFSSKADEQPRAWACTRGVDALEKGHARKAAGKIVWASQKGSEARPARWKKLDTAS